MSQSRLFPNVNKLFPRLSLRAKLAIAFAAIAIIPLGIVAYATVRITVARLRAVAQETLRHDLDTARDQAERVIAHTERDAAYVAEALVRPLEPPEQWRAGVSAFLDHTTALLQIRVLGPDGGTLGVARGAATPLRPVLEEDGGMYYALRAAELAPGERLVLPVELRGGRRPEDPQVVPVLAFIVPVFSDAGEPLATIVGEARAAEMFAGLDLASPQFAGVTVLADADGNVLYHSEVKRDWMSLLARARSAAGARWTAGGDTLLPDWSTSREEELVFSRPLRLGGSRTPPLTLLRAIPLATLNRPIRQFLIAVAATGAALLAVVLVLAIVAARQLTGPIYRLRTAAAHLARGGEPTDLRIATNDELEDLAADFTAMGQTLTMHRRNLESLVAERTAALQRTHAELRDILAHSADAIVALDPVGRVRLWNDGAARLFGYTPVEAVGRDANALLLPSGPGGSPEHRFIERELATHGAVVNFATVRRSKSGALIPVSLTQSVIRDAQGRIQGSSLILRDTGMQTRVEEHMRRSERLAAVSVLTAGVAHEINNPLAIITNRLECMEDELAHGPESLRADLRVLRGHAERLSEVTRNLLRFARNYDESPSAVDLAAVLNRLVGLLERTLVRRQVLVRVDLAAEVPLVWGSESGFETVGLNLMLNAADAMPDGGTIAVELRDRGRGTSVELAVTDEGTGVPPDLRDRIFEAFFTTKRDGHGTGLGLAVCRSIVERQGGRIRCEPATPRGSRFVVTLPAWTAEGP